MAELTYTAGEVSGDMPLSPQAVAIGDQPFQPHRTPWGKGLGADADLGTEAVTEAIRKAGGAVVIDPGTVDGPQKPFRVVPLVVAIASVCREP